MESPHNEESPCSSGVAACNLPTLVTTPGADMQNESILTNSTGKYDKYLVIKHQKTGSNLCKESPFKIEKALKSILGENYKCKISPKFRSGLLLVEVDQRDSHDKLLRTKDLCGIPVNVEPHKTLNISKGTIICDSLDQYTNDELKEQLDDQDVIEVYRTKKYEKGKQIDSNLYIVTFAKPTIPNEVKIGFLNIKVRQFIPNPWRCEKCQRFGHKDTYCTHAPVCAKCGKTDPGHGYGDCGDDTCCVNCSGNHPASSKQCPLWQLEKKINQMKHEYNLKYPEAKAQVIYDNPDLVNKIPSLRQSKSKSKTYSSVASSSSAAEKCQNQQQLIFEQLKQQMEQMQKQIQLLTDIVKGLFINPVATATPNVSAPDRPKRTREVSSSSEDETRPRSKISLKSTSSGQEVSNMSAPPPPSDTSIRGAVGGSPSLSSKEVKSAASLPSKQSEATPMDDTPVGGPSPPPRRARDPTGVRGSSGTRDPSGGREPSVDRRPTGGGKEPRAPSSNRGGKNKTPLNRNGPAPTKTK